MKRQCLALLAACSLPLINQAQATAQAVDSIPTVNRMVNGRVVKIPDFSKINWDNMPPASTSGYLEVPSSLTNQLGFNLSRSWKAGQKPATYTMVGDLDEAFGLGKLSLKDITKLQGSDRDIAGTLADFGVIEKQTLSSLLKAVPQIGDLDVSQVKPIQDLLGMNGILVSSGIVSNLVGQNSQVGDLPLKQLDLKRYGLDSIPGELLISTPLSAFNQYQETFVSQIPGLSQVPLAKLAPKLFGDGLNLDFFAIADLYWGNTGKGNPAEHGDPRVPDSQFVSGRVTCVGKNVPLAPKPGKSYGYIELTDSTRGGYYGNRWASGSDQSVKGGCGILAAINNGQEPSGRLVYGTDVLKIVLEKVDQQGESASFKAYTHICAHLPLGGKTCTPYCFSAFPWLGVDGQNWVQIGKGSL